MEWYWKDGQNHLSKSDYEFVYSIWNNGVSVYGKNIQERMNWIRDKYVESINGKPNEGKTKYGIKIVKPWSQEMYDHNDKIAKLMKSEIKQQVITAYSHGHDYKIREFAKFICGSSFGTGYTIHDIYDRCIKELDTMENFRLNEEYPYMVKSKLVTDQPRHMVGY